LAAITETNAHDKRTPKLSRFPCPCSVRNWVETTGQTRV